MALRAGSKLCLHNGDRALADRCIQTMALLAGNIPDPANSTEANSLLLLAGLGDTDRAEAVLLANGDGGMSTLLSYYTLTALAERGRLDAALKMLKSYYGGMLDMGATTFWENFHTEWLRDATPIDALPTEGKRDVHGGYGEHCYKGFRHSLCHGWAAGPVPFLAEQVLGIRVTEAGGAHIHLSPNLCDLQFAKGSYPTKYGAVTVAYEKRGDQTVLTELTHPKACTVSIDESVVLELARH